VRNGARQSRLRAVQVVLACAGVTLSSGAGAQPSAGPDRPEDLAARALARVVLQDLKLAESPGVRDFRIAAELLEIARKLSPREQQILRLLIEAQSNAGNEARVQELTRELVRLDPQDTVAQLRLIAGRINAIQSVEERLLAYERFLGPDGQQLDASIRSRLALDSALLVRESGDIEGFADRVTRAMELDPTNKDAATLALSFYSERENDPVGRMDLLLAVLYADPFDPGIHRAIARQLAQTGAFQGAERFLRTLDRLYVAQGITPGVDEQTFREVVDWNIRGAESVVRRLTDQLEDGRKDLLRRRQVQAQARSAGTLPGNVDDIPPPEDFRLPFASERTRLIAASAMGDIERASNAMSELAETARRLAERLADPRERSAEIGEDDVTRQIHGILGEVVWLRLWSGLQTDEAATGLSVLRKDASADAAVIRRLEGWLALRRGEDQKATTILGELAETDPLARLGLVLMQERAADVRPVVDLYADLAGEFSGELLGAFARTRVVALTRSDILKTDNARQLELLAASVPDWIESILENASRVVSLDVEPERTDIRLMERTPLRVTMTNLAPVALGVGPEKPLNSRVLLVPSVDVQSVPIGGGELVEVVSLDRRLRLLPRESFQTTVWGDAGQLGLLLDLSSGGPSRVRWKALQGFRVSTDGLYEKGPHGVQAESIMLSRRPTARFLVEGPGLKTSIETGGPREVGEAILALRARQARTVEFNALPPGDVASIMDTAALRFAGADKPLKVMMLALLPTAIVQPEASRVDDVARADTDLDVQRVLLGLRLMSDKDEAFTVARAGGDDIADFASLVRERLSDQGMTYAKLASDVKPAVAPLIGPPRPDDASRDAGAPQR
jgi:tetratricopeptide (TPR) repeat protein